MAVGARLAKPCRRNQAVEARPSKMGGSGEGTEELALPVRMRISGGLKLAASKRPCRKTNKSYFPHFYRFTIFDFIENYANRNKLISNKTMDLMN